jgi:hypothetical protein
MEFLERGAPRNFGGGRIVSKWEFFRYPFREVGEGEGCGFLKSTLLSRGG